MRYVIIGFCVFAAACGASPTAPSASVTTPSVSQINGGMRTPQARSGSELPFTGTYQGVESVATVPSQHHLDAAGNATHLGRFAVTAYWTVTPAGAIDTASTWRAANGDELHTSFTRSRAMLTFTEVHTIVGGTGRFANASGVFTVVQIRALSALPSDNSATIDGTINLRDDTAVLADD
jgi:hypothetical protein